MLHSRGRGDLKRNQIRLVTRVETLNQALKSIELGATITPVSPRYPVAVPFVLKFVHTDKSFSSN